jgi:hypothetical protein
MFTHTCKACGNSFQSERSASVYCTMKCSSAAKIKGSLVKCAVCEKPFWRFPSTGKTYCSKSCMMTARNLTDKNPSFHRDISGEKNPMFGRRRVGADNPMFGRRGDKCSRWKGGRRKRPDGYIRVIAPPGHPRPSESKNGVSYILEHRLVVERTLGRYLTEDEVVHHIDGNPSNNAAENLLVMSKSDHARHHQPKGVRVGD